MSRYESFERIPLLHRALACEVIFGVPLRTLFRGLYADIEEHVIRRAYQMHQDLEHCTDSEARKNLELLKGMLARATKKPN